LVFKVYPKGIADILAKTNGGIYDDTWTEGKSEREDEDLWHIFQCL
jgi:hypothetical protein